MIRPSSTSSPTTTYTLDYELTEADVGRFCAFGIPRACRRSCRGRKAALLGLTALGLFLVGICFHSRGVRTGSLAVGTTLAVLGALAWSRQVVADRRVRRLGQAIGLPCPLRLVVSTEGLTKEPGPDLADHGRAFAWSDVVEVARIDGLTVLFLRPAGGVVIVPDRAFPGPEARETFIKDARAWSKAEAI